MLTIDHGMTHINSVQSNIFETLEFKVSIFGPTPIHISLKYRGDDKRSNQVRACYFVWLWY